VIGTGWWVWPLLLGLLPLLLALLALWLLYGALLLLLVWMVWLPRGRDVLVVYSNSPVWQRYFEEQVLPVLASRCVVLNWSERQRWRFSMPVLLFRCFGGEREFNPLAVVFQPFRWPRRFRFYKPFKAFKHGRPEEVERLRGELFELLDAIAPR
jgi:hypothetical protein